MAKSRSAEKQRRLEPLAEARLQTARLIACSSFLQPDERFYDTEPLKPLVSLQVTEGERFSDWTSFIFVIKAVVPANDEKSKEPSWELETSFFTVLTHDGSVSNASIEEYTRVTAVPLLLMRFVGLAETLAALGGFPIELAASSGLDVEKAEVKIADRRKTAEDS
jgi:hypothetical protein